MLLSSHTLCSFQGAQLKNSRRQKPSSGLRLKRTNHTNSLDSTFGFIRRREEELVSGKGKFNVVSGYCQGLFRRNSQPLCKLACIFVRLGIPSNARAIPQVAQDLMVFRNFSLADFSSRSLFRPILNAIEVCSVASNFKLFWRFLFGKLNTIQFSKARYKRGCNLKGCIQFSDFLQGTRPRPAAREKYTGAARAASIAWRRNLSDMFSSTRTRR
jgi:hypothetical protein